MQTHLLRTLLPLALATALCACSAGTAPEDDGAEQEQALADAQQAAESAATPPEGTGAAAPPLECDDTQVQGLVGQVLEESTAEQARVDAGAKSVRVLEPGQMVTMEFDGERLNIEVDGERKIVALRCG
ncbi:I78 family peptidase inhibitor [Pseudoxanthomonas koreensis]|uniref:I78 family peptidase inhibitor n=1 Tax=Pseudoxanthomonas koreensis TaxID=266061 RepID=UPI00139138D5|nr:Elastase inhibitor AFLEI Flags: Precursor [Pseudoxanthomonas koreensis]